MKYQALPPMFGVVFEWVEFKISVKHHRPHNDMARWGSNGASNPFLYFSADSAIQIKSHHLCRELVTRRPLADFYRRQERSTSRIPEV
jgi:hypothetical protein